MIFKKFYMALDRGLLGLNLFLKCVFNPDYLGGITSIDWDMGCAIF